LQEHGVKVVAVQVQPIQMNHVVMSYCRGSSFMQSMLLASESALSLPSRYMLNHKKTSKLISNVLTGYLTRVSMF
jgi:hypothetical protein